jgi:hypothetical protein
MKWGLMLHGGRLDGELLWYESDEPPPQVEVPTGDGGEHLAYTATGTVDGTGHRKYVLDPASDRTRR